MLHRIGFACKILGVPNIPMKGCLLKNASPEALLDIVRGNLQTLSRMLSYVESARLDLFRISSDVIPLASHPALSFEWRKVYEKELAAIGEQIRRSGIRVSMHPGQYTVLNSPSDEVAERAVMDLAYHADFMDSLGVDASSKIILHVGGVYGDREKALERFALRFAKLPANVVKRLVLENDEKCFAIHEVLPLCRKLGIPAVMDVLHHAILPAPHGLTKDWIEACSQTWNADDGRQKIHYSQQQAGGKTGMHSKTIAPAEFMRFSEELEDLPLDIMLEVKDKNLSAVKCRNCIASRLPPNALEEEWARYKYLVMEHSHKHYLSIRELFKNAEVKALDFYQLVDEALEQATVTGGAVNAAQHVWGYFKKEASVAEKKKYEGALQKFSNAALSPTSFKGFLFSLAEKYDKKYLLSSLYFYCE